MEFIFLILFFFFPRVSSHVDDFKTEIRFWQQNFSDKDIDIIYFVRRFQNFIGGILTEYLNIMSD